MELNSYFHNANIESDGIRPRYGRSTEYVLVRSTVYATEHSTFVILTGSVHATARFNSIYLT